MPNGLWLSTPLLPSCIWQGPIYVNVLASSLRKGSLLEACPPPNVCRRMRVPGRAIAMGGGAAPLLEHLPLLPAPSPFPAPPPSKLSSYGAGDETGEASSLCNSVTPGRNSMWEGASSCATQTHARKKQWAAHPLFLQGGQERWRRNQASLGGGLPAAFPGLAQFGDGEEVARLGVPHFLWE